LRLANTTEAQAAQIALGHENAKRWKLLEKQALPLTLAAGDAFIIGGGLGIALRNGINLTSSYINKYRPKLTAKLNGLRENLSRRNTLRSDFLAAEFF
jgi:hypothetical protein